MLRHFVTVTAVLAAFASLGCEDEKKPPVQPNPPRYVDGSIRATCRPVDGIWSFSSFKATIEDQDGVGTLGDPVIVVEATRIYPTSIDEQKVPPDGGTPEEIAELPPTLVTYRWAYDRESGDPNAQDLIYCGESAETLTLKVKFSVTDEDGFIAHFVAPVVAE